MRAPRSLQNNLLSPFPLLRWKVIDLLFHNNYNFVDYKITNLISLELIYSTNYHGKLYCTNLISLVVLVSRTRKAKLIKLINIEIFYSQVDLYAYMGMPWWDEGICSIFRNCRLCSLNNNLSMLFLNSKILADPKIIINMNRCD